MKNSGTRKESQLKEIIEMEIYIRRTNHYSLDILEHTENIYSYVHWGDLTCGKELDTYRRGNISTTQFRKDIPEIIQHLKSTKFYKHFKDYKTTEYSPNILDTPIEYLIEFIENEQKNLKIVKITDDYICFNIKY